MHAPLRATDPFPQPRRRYGQALLIRKAVRRRRGGGARDASNARRLTQGDGCAVPTWTERGIAEGSRVPNDTVASVTRFVTRRKEPPCSAGCAVSLADCPARQSACPASRVLLSGTLTSLHLLQLKRFVIAVGWMPHPNRPASPINIPSAVGTNAAQNSHRFFVSAVSARREIASAISVSDRSN